MAEKFKPLEIQDIDEGRFVGASNADLAEIQRKLIEHIRQYGAEACKGVKAKLKVEITLQFEGRDATDYSIKATTRKEFPGRPASVTVAMADDEQDGRPCLFVRRSGSTNDNPRQGALTTQDGRVIDQKTGEAKK